MGNAESADGKIEERESKPVFEENKIFMVNNLRVNVGESNREINYQIIKSK